VSASTGNPLGLDPKDPAGKDDIVVPTLTVPVDHQIELLIRSQDVIHNFYVRELRLQQDAVPGMVIPIHFTANQIGHYEITVSYTHLDVYKRQRFHRVTAHEPGAVLANGNRPGFFLPRPAGIFPPKPDRYGR